MAKKPSEKEDESMETYNAKIVKCEDQHHIEFDIAGDVLRISMTEDLPNDVKMVFNKLIIKLKNGLFCFKLTDPESDIFSQIALEYITQLNSELSTVFKELQHHNLLSSTIATTK